MDWLNYHHLLYFRTVAREGSVTGAARKLRLAQSTVSAQLRLLEESLGVTLLDRKGRTLQLTEEGRAVLQYADEISALGRELMARVRERGSGALPRLVVGVVDAVPKLVVYRLLAPLLQGASAPPLVCVEGDEERLVQRLLAHEVNLVLSDGPAEASAPVRTFNHLLGDSAVSFFAAPTLVRALRSRFPQCLDQAPLLLPTARTGLRQQLIDWLDARQLRPRCVAEFDDGALLKAFASGGHGVFAAPTIMTADLRRQYGVQPLGPADGVRARFYAVSAERRLSHPSALALLENARNLLETPLSNPSKKAMRPSGLAVRQRPRRAPRSTHSSPPPAQRRRPFMLIHFRVRALSHSSALPLERLRGRVEHALESFQSRVRLVEVRLEESDGSRHGVVHLRCRVDVRLRDGSLLVSKAAGETLLGALDMALLRSHRRLRHDLDRWLSLSLEDLPRLPRTMAHARSTELFK